MKIRLTGQPIEICLAVQALSGICELEVTEVAGPDLSRGDLRVTLHYEAWLTPHGGDAP